MKNFIFMILLAGLPVLLSAQLASWKQELKRGYEFRCDEMQGKATYEKLCSDTVAQMLNSRKAIYKKLSAGKQKMDSLTEVHYDDNFQIFIDKKLVFAFNSEQKQLECTETRLDGTIWVKLKDEYTYDPDGNMIMRTTFRWIDAEAEWKFISKEDFSYNTDGKLLQRIRYLWDTENLIWIPQEKTVNTFDLSGNKLSEVVIDWKADSNQWMNFYRLDFTYDTANQIIKAVFSSWVLPEKQWVENLKDEYSFDANGNMTLYASYSSYELVPQWQGNTKEEYAYDADDHLSSSFTYEWNTGTSDWKVNRKNEYSYNAAGKETQWLYLSWDDIQNQWTGLSKAVTDYDSVFNKTQTVFYAWFAGLNQWVGENRNVYVFNTDNLEIQMACYKWSAAMLEWIPYYKIDRSYDAYSNTTELLSWEGTLTGWELSTKYSHNFNTDFALDGLVLPMQVAYDYNELQYMLTLSDYSVWDKNSVNWRQVEHKEFFYSGLSLTEIDDTKIRLLLYPNPATDIISISIPGVQVKFQLELYNESGNLVLTKWLENNQSLSIRQLPAGMYTYKIAMGKIIYSGKLVKQ